MNASKTVSRQNGTTNGIHYRAGEMRDSSVVGQTSQGTEIRATLLRLSRFLAVFEVYNPAIVLRSSEVLDDFKIVVQDRTLYGGRAVVRALVNGGAATICEVALDEGSWIDVEFTSEMLGNGKLREQFKDFMEEWEKSYRIVAEYKLIVADMHSFFTNLRLWLDQVELSIRSVPSGDRLRLEHEVTDELAAPILPCVDALFDKFETVAKTLEEDLHPAHRSYMRRQLHPFILSAPFAYRAFNKPLGYAGDYEMVNMIARNLHEGGTLFAKVVNTWFLRQPPAQAHRNRINYLAAVLAQETSRANLNGKPSRIFNLACGPAQEVQKFLVESPQSRQAKLTLADFNDETLQYAQTTLGEIKQRHGLETDIQYVRKSVHAILKESGRAVEQAPGNHYDLVYCAGLFDYLSDQVCSRLLNIMYEWVAPGGLLVATNVEPSNPHRNGMDHLLDWHLMYRTAHELKKLAPAKAPADTCRVHSDATGVNLFLEVRKPGS